MRKAELKAAANATVLSLVCLVLNGCRPHINALTQEELARVVLQDASDSETCRAAINRITNENLLVKIAVGASDSYVCTKAVRKLDNQASLLEIAMSSTRNDLGQRAAVEKLDQENLARVALESERSSASYSALVRITNQHLLHKIAVSRIGLIDAAAKRLTAEKRLTDQDSLFKDLTESKSVEPDDVDRIVVSALLEKPLMPNGVPPSESQYETRVGEVIAKVQRALAAIPKERQPQIAFYLLRVGYALSDPFVKSELGEYALSASYETVTETYRGGRYSGSATGEVLTCTLNRTSSSPPLPPSHERYSERWGTVFPENTIAEQNDIMQKDLGFQGAHVSVFELLDRVYGSLSPQTLERLANDKCVDVRKAAVHNITNLDILAKLAIEDDDSRVRELASNKKLSLLKLR